MRENDLYKEVSQLAMPDFDEVKQKVVSSKTKKFPIKSVVAVAACLVAAVGATALSQNFRNTPVQTPTGQCVINPSSKEDFSATTPDLNTDPVFNDKIVYNKIGVCSSASLACVCADKPYALASYKDIIRVIPERLNEMHYQEIYGIPDELLGTEAALNDENYTELHTYLLSFIKPDSATGIEIKFSKKGEPLRDCFYECGKKLLSSISGVDVLLNGNPNDKFSTCIATFKIELENETLWFDIEFNEITEEEMLKVLRTVISMAKSYQMSAEPVTEPVGGEEFDASELFSQIHSTTEAPVTEPSYNRIEIVP